MLFEAAEVAEDWRREWAGMPEFVMGNGGPYQRIAVLFSSPAEVAEFAALLHVKLTRRTSTIWFREPEGYKRPTHYRYVVDGEPVVEVEEGEPAEPLDDVDDDD